MNKNEEIIAIHNRRYACKSFDPDKKISPTNFNTIMEAARLSPSSFGFEPWKFLLVESDKVKNDIRPFSWGAINSLDGASHFVIALARKDLTAKSNHVKHLIEDVKGRTLEQMSNQLHFFENFQKTDFDLLSSERALFDWSSKQTYLALANMMTTAQFLEIDSCPIEGFNKCDLETYLSEQSLIDSTQFGVSYMVAFGYRAEEQPEKTRQQMDDILQII